MPKNKHLILLAILMLVVALDVRPPFSVDTWQHLRTGQWIVEHHAVPHTDPFSWTFNGRPWEFPGWIVQIMLYGVYAAWGIVGINLWTILFVLLSFIVVYFTCEGPLVLRLIVLPFAALIASLLWVARPLMLSVLLAAVFAYLFNRYRRERRMRDLWLLPPLMMLWANAHDGFVIGFAMIGAVMVGEGLRVVLRREPWVALWETLRPWSVILALCLVAACVNPFGPSLLLHPFRQVSIHWVMTHIFEWMPPDQRDPATWIFFGLALLSFFAYRKSVDFVDLIFFVLFGYLAIQSRRHIPLFIVITTPIVVKHLNYIWEARSAASRRSGKTVQWLRDARRALLGMEEARGTWIGWGLVGLLGVVIALRLPWVLSPDSVAHYNQTSLPTRAVEFILAHDPPLPKPMFNDYNFGSYFLWALYPDYPVYVDGRADLYGDEWLERYYRITSAQPDYQRLLDADGVNLAVAQASFPLAKLLKENRLWTQIYADELVQIYERVTLME
jgi:hypothetical protein